MSLSPVTIDCRTSTPTTKMSDKTSVNNEVAIDDNAVDTSDNSIKLRARIDELETNQTKLLELLFDMVKQRADSVGSDKYMEQLEEALEDLRTTLKDTKQTTERLRKRLMNVEHDNTHLVLVAKMYKGESEAHNEHSVIPYVPKR